MAAMGAGLFLAGAAIGVAGSYALQSDLATGHRTAERSEPGTPGDGLSYEDAGQPDDLASASDAGTAGRDTAAKKPRDEAAEPHAKDAQRPPKWRRNAAPIPDAGADKPRIAIVIDDLGLSVEATRTAIELPSPLTLSFLTYAPSEDLTTLTAAARDGGHEVMAHVPMQAASENVNPGPHALTDAMSAQALRANLTWGLNRLSGYVGINNHMGSALTADETAMQRVMAELDERGLLFLDSRTTAETRATQAADAAGVPYTERDVFLDNAKDRGAIREQLRELEAAARRKGTAVAIGHPYEVTLSVLASWMPEARRRGIAFVPVSAAVDQADRRNVAALPE